jgi:hypothetical protein
VVNKSAVVVAAAEILVDGMIHEKPVVPPDSAMIELVNGSDASAQFVIFHEYNEV